MASDHLHCTYLESDVPLACLAMGTDAKADGLKALPLCCSPSAMDNKERVRCTNCSSHRCCSAVKGAFSKSASVERGDWDML